MRQIHPMFATSFVTEAVNLAVWGVVGPCGFSSPQKPWLLAAWVSSGAPIPYPHFTEQPLSLFTFNALKSDQITIG
jgi:hypothetical protein